MSLLGGGGSILGSVDLLSIARRTRAPGIGLSAQSRNLTNKFLNQTRGAGSNLFAAGVADGVETLQLQILALRSRVPESKLSSNLAFGDSDRGNNVDTEA